MACSAALAAAKVACFTFGKKPQVTQEEVDKRGDELMYSLISPESIMFSCLASALMLTDYNRQDR